MRSAWSRRDVLAATTAAVLVTGCSSSRGTDAPSTDAVAAPDRYDCDDVTRPDPDDPAAEDALDPVAYPSRPESLATDGIEFVTDFERAYRQNAVIDEYGDAARAFEFDRIDWELSVIEPARDADDDTEAATATDDGAVDPVLVAVVYDLSVETTVGEHDEWDVRVTYYVDDSVVLRARYAGIANEPTIDPDPRRDGEPVVCFGNT